VFSDPDEQLVYDFCSTFYRDHAVDDPVFERVKQRFGERGLVDLTGLIGYYSFVSVTLNVFEVPVPPGAALLPK
jgi:4-carboxymuconolactone decarboxylase